MQPPIDESWRQDLSLTDEGKIRPTATNIGVILARHPAWQGVLVYDEFADSIITTRPPPWGEYEDTCPRAGVWTDQDDTRLGRWLLRTEGVDFKRDLGPHVMVEALKHRRHPVREYLSSLAWDGEPRNLADYLGAAGQLAPLACRWLMISAVARIYEPGCKVDTMAVLLGEQGRRKSTAIKAVFGAEWFSDTTIDLSNKDSYLALRGKWCIEWAEFESASRFEQGRIKAFVSSPSDHYRPPYGKRAIQVPRQTVFCATSNHREVLKDETGGRRYWPFWCERIDDDGISRDRDQLWAQAVAEYRAGARWWPVTPDELAVCGEAQEDARSADAWETAIRRWLRERTATRVTIDEVASGALGIELARVGKAEQTRIGAIMCAPGSGWSVRRVREGGERVRVYERDAGVEASCPTSVFWQ